MYVKEKPLSAMVIDNFLAIDMTRRFCLPSISDHILISK